MVRKAFAPIILVALAATAACSAEPVPPTPFEFPTPAAVAPTPAPTAPETTPEATPKDTGSLLGKGLKNWTAEDWQKFIDFIMPIVLMLVGAFGGGIALKAKKRFSDVQGRGQRRLLGILTKLDEVEKRLKVVHEQVGGEEADRKRAQRREVLKHLRDSIKDLDDE